MIQSGGDCIRVGGLNHIRTDTEPGCALSVSWVAGVEQHRDPGELGVRPQKFGEPPSVHPWHCDIDQHRARPESVTELSKGVLAAATTVRFEANRMKVEHQGATDVVVIVDDQNHVSMRVGHLVSRSGNAAKNQR